MVFSKIEDEKLYEDLYFFIKEGFDILNYYINFGSEMYKENKPIWKIHLVIRDPKIKNRKKIWKKENQRENIIYRDIFFIESEKEKWKKNLIRDISGSIHEYCHFYFSYFHNKKGFRYKKLYSWFEEGFAEMVQHEIENKFLAEKKDWYINQFERVKNDDKLFKRVWDFKAGNLVVKHKRRIFFMKLTFRSNEKIKKYIYDFWRDFDNLYFLSFGIILNMKEYYGEEKFKEILIVYREGIEKEKLKKFAEESIKAKW